MFPWTILQESQTLKTTTLPQNRLKWFPRRLRAEKKSVSQIFFFITFSLWLPQCCEFPQSYEFPQSAPFGFLVGAASLLLLSSLVSLTSQIFSSISLFCFTFPSSRIHFSQCLRVSKSRWLSHSAWSPFFSISLFNPASTLPLTSSLSRQLHPPASTFSVSLNISLSRTFSVFPVIPYVTRIPSVSSVIFGLLNFLSFLDYLWILQFFCLRDFLSLLNYLKFLLFTQSSRFAQSAQLPRSFQLSQPPQSSWFSIYSRFIRFLYFPKSIVSSPSSGMYRLYVIRHIIILCH